MNRQAQALWASLEFRKPAMLRLVDLLSPQHLLWRPPNGANSIAWLVWHIAEVEDNWIRDVVYAAPKRYPFGVPVRSARLDQYPANGDLLDYFHEVRELTKGRLEGTTEADLDRRVQDAHFGPLSVREIWAGVATSFAWHAGQIALIANRLLPRDAKA